MVSRMVLTGQKTSPILVDSPSSVRAYGPSYYDMQSPSSRGETLSIRKRRFGIDRMAMGETRSTELCGIAEETFTSPADTVMTKISSARKAVSISNRRGYRPLSVKIGEVFNPFSTRESNIDSVELAQGITESARANSREPRKGIELSKKVNWSENLDPHIFNANFVATLTSKRGFICVLDELVLSANEIQLLQISKIIRLSESILFRCKILSPYSSTQSHQRVHRCLADPIQSGE
jgi:hypothetical protein